MTSKAKAALWTVGVIGAILLALVIAPGSSKWLHAKKFEWKVRAKMDPDKLQAWAADLLNRFPPERRFYLDLRGTNLPPGMAEIKGYAHNVSIVIGEEHVPRVVLFGALGDPAILVGPTNFVTTNQEAKIWKAGIYFRQAH